MAAEAPDPVKSAAETDAASVPTTDEDILRLRQRPASLPDPCWS